MAIRRNLHAHTDLAKKQGKACCRNFWEMLSSLHSGRVRIKNLSHSSEAGTWSKTTVHGLAYMKGNKAGWRFGFVFRLNLLTGLDEIFLEADSYGTQHAKRVGRNLTFERNIDRSRIVGIRVSLWQRTTQQNWREYRREILASKTFTEFTAPRVVANPKF